jgi:hypothetical protein
VGHDGKPVLNACSFLALGHAQSIDIRTPCAFAALAARGGGGGYAAWVLSAGYRSCPTVMRADPWPDGALAAGWPE